MSYLHTDKVTLLDLNYNYNLFYKRFKLQRIFYDKKQNKFFSKNYFYSILKKLRHFSPFYSMYFFWKQFYPTYFYFFLEFEIVFANKEIKI